MNSLMPSACADVAAVRALTSVPSMLPAGPKDYLNAALITLGCTLFLMTGSVKSRHASSDSSVFGLMLMLGYLGFDGFTSTFQDKLFKVRVRCCACSPLAPRRATNRRCRTLANCL